MRLNPYEVSIIRDAFFRKEPGRLLPIIQLVGTALVTEELRRISADVGVDFDFYLYELAEGDRDAFSLDQEEFL